MTPEELGRRLEEAAIAVCLIRRCTVAWGEGKDGREPTLADAHRAQSALRLLRESPTPLPDWSPADWDRARARVLSDSKPL